MEANIDRTRISLIREYIEACNSGDPSRIAQHFTTDATHYFTRQPPVSGSRAIGDHFSAMVADLGCSWSVDDGIEQGAEACIEWSVIWRDTASGELRLNRGTEWYRFREDLICEVRAYYHSDARNRTGDLIGFDHTAAGHTTIDRAASGRASRTGR